MQTWDIIIFVTFIIGVVSLGLFKSRKTPEDAIAQGETSTKQNTKDFFLAGGSLSWWIIGFSLIAANISAEQFVGMSGQACDSLGMAIASYEWLAAITLVFVAFLFLPKFLKSGIFTIPEFLEYRFDSLSRILMAIFTMVILVGVPTAGVIYAGSLIMDIFFKGEFIPFTTIPITITTSCWTIGILATIYVFVGGLKACAWADLIQGSALIVGGAIVAYLAMDALGSADVASLVASPNVTGIGGVSYTNANLSDPTVIATLKEAGPIERLFELNSSKFHMFLPSSDSRMPWTALIFCGLWIPNFFYWGLNQYITQRTLAAKSLNEGQRGIIFAAGMKLIIPFIVVVIGILAYNIFNPQLKTESNWRTAALVSMAPSLYEKMSDEFTIENIAKDPEASHVVESIKKNMDEKETLLGKKNVFVFDEDFARFHIADAQKIALHNIEMTGIAPSTQLNLNATFLPVQMNEKDSAFMSYVKALTLYNKDAATSISEENKKLISSYNIAGYNYDSTYGILLKKLVKNKVGIAGFVLAAIFGAVVSSLAAMLNSASTIFTLDLYHRIKPKAADFELVAVGKLMIVIFMLIACFLAPTLGDPAFGGIFTFIQEFQGFISPGVLAIFLVGILVPRAPRICGRVGLILCPALYGFLKFANVIIPNCETTAWLSALSFLDRMSICFVAILIVLGVMTFLKPLPEPLKMPVNEKMDMRTKTSTKIWGLIVIVVTIALYVIFF